jgi:ribokinase
VGAGTLSDPILRPAAVRFRGLVGTGGIGSGSFFLLNGDHTLGREESRSGRFLNRRDYCKLHIVFHYLRVLLGEAASIVPIGRVGDDAAGRELLGEMREVGLDLREVKTTPGAATLFSFCFLYPDGTGGNLTTDDSASGRVDCRAIDRAEELFASFGESGLAVALPEVPVEARLHLLDLATKHGLFRAASFTSEELPALRKRGVIGALELLALNIDEARALAGLAEPTLKPLEVAERAVSDAAEEFPGLMLSITAGAAGSWSWDGRQLAHCPAVEVEAASTAGAGDAHLAGILAGLTCGLDLPSASVLGTLVAGASVTSPHTIHKGLSREQLCELWAGPPAEGAAGARGRLACEGPGTGALFPDRALAELLGGS